MGERKSGISIQVFTIFFAVVFFIPGLLADPFENTKSAENSRFSKSPGPEPQKGAAEGKRSSKDTKFFENDRTEGENLFPLQRWYFSRILESRKGTFPFIPVQSPLASFVNDPFPWFHLAANSEQRQPVYFGASPREISFGFPNEISKPVSIPFDLKECGEKQLLKIYRVMVDNGSVQENDELIIEGWPIRDDYGRLSWTFARWGLKNFAIVAKTAHLPIRGEWGLGMDDWKWFNAGLLPEEETPRLNRSPVFPILLDPRIPADFGKIFDDVLALPDLYDKPLFGDTIWTSGEQGETIIEAWPPVEMLARYRNFLLSAMKISAIRPQKGAKDAKIMENDRFVPRCRVLPQPARINGKPVSFFLTVKSDGVAWPGGISWENENSELEKRTSYRPIIRTWPADFLQKYRADVLYLDGEREAVFPISGRRIRFLRKNSIERDNQLQDLVTYLEERYKVLNVKTFRQDFVWRGIKQSNLIAVLPSKDGGVPANRPDGDVLAGLPSKDGGVPANRPDGDVLAGLPGRVPGEKPVLMADHIDTAFCEEVFEETKKRVSAPGADDNFSATAVLLRAAEIFSRREHERDIWLVHFTGEEFPADDLGARIFVSKLLREKRDIEGLVLMDLIGHRENNTRIFQVNPGNSGKSLEMAKVAMDVAPSVCRFKPVLRTRYDDRSYLYNTDGLIFSENGFPTLYFNEHINKLENMDRIGYHHTLDNSSKMDWDYAVSIGKVAIETAAHLARTK